MNELSSYINIFADQDICDFIAMKDKEFMRSYFQNLYDYQESLMKDRSFHKISDASDKS